MGVVILTFIGMVCFFGLIWLILEFTEYHSADCCRGTERFNWQKVKTLLDRSRLTTDSLGPDGDKILIYTTRKGEQVIIGLTFYAYLRINKLNNKNKKTYLTYEDVIK